MTEAKGNDVRAAQDIPPMTDEEKRKHAELSEKMRLLFQECSQFGANEMSVYWGIFAYRVNQEIEARVQAAAVEMRERCAEVSHGVFKSYGTVKVSDAIRALPIPTSVLDAMLRAARLQEISAIIDGMNSGWTAAKVWTYIGERQAALTQPALSFKGNCAACGKAVNVDLGTQWASKGDKVWHLACVTPAFIEQLRKAAAEK